MSVQINCDRCGQDTNEYFRIGDITIKRGCYASTVSKDFVEQWGKSWHLCIDCAASLKRWSEPGTKVIYASEAT